MPGMTSGIGTSNTLIAEAFRSALRHQLIIVAAIFLVLWLARLIAARSWPMPRAMAANRDRPAGKAPRSAARPEGRTATEPEPPGRRLLRIGFGILWIFDGILQAQPAMPIGMPAQVIKPTAASSPAWVQHLVNAAGTVWTYHPIQISAAAVWIQVGIGLWLLFARQGPWARLGALASVGWGLLVWVFGESFGGIFAPGLTWLFGAPGAVLLYCAAGALLALPEDAWRTPRLGRLILAGTGVFFVGMAVLQAWPGRGFWQGNLHGQPGTLTGMIRSMSQTPQPHFLARIVAAFANFVAAHGFAVNLFTVIALAAIGAAFLSGQPRLARLGVGRRPRALPGGLGAHRGPRLPRRGGHRPEQHDPDGAAVRLRVSRHDPGTRTPGCACRGAREGSGQVGRRGAREGSGQVGRRGARKGSGQAGRPADRPSHGPRGRLG